MTNPVWPFIKQNNKNGYINNPNWVETANDLSRHHPCGYWWSEGGISSELSPNYYSIFSCGSYTNGQLMRTVDGLDYSSFKKIDKSSIKDYSPGSNNSFIVTSTGVLWGVGSNSKGELGLGHELPIGSLTKIFSSDVAFCFIGDTLASFIIKTDGTLWTSGFNNQGQLGLGDTNDRNEFEQVGTDSNWASIYNNYYVTYGLKTNGDVWSWGIGQFNATGHGDTNPRYSPERVTALNNIKICRVGYYNAFAIDSHNHLYVVGRNNQYQLGLGDDISRDNFTIVPGKWLDVAPSQSTHFSTLFIDTNGRLYGVGNNQQGQLGLGDTLSREIMEQVETDNDWKSVICGSTHAIALKKDGRMYGTGSNSGQLGLGDLDRRVSFSLIGDNYVSVKTGQHSLATKVM